MSVLKDDNSKLFWLRVGIVILQIYDILASRAHGFLHMLKIFGNHFLHTKELDLTGSLESWQTMSKDRQQKRNGRHCF